MSTPVRVVAFLAALAAVFGITVAAGRVVGPVGSASASASDEDGHGHAGEPQPAPEPLRRRVVRLSKKGVTDPKVRSRRGDSYPGPLHYERS